MIQDSILWNGQTPCNSVCDTLVELSAGDNSMRIFRTKRAALAVGILTFAAATWLSAQKTATSPNVDAPVNVNEKVLRDAGSVTNDALPDSWLSYGRNQSETRYSTLKQINDTNAKRLGLAWTYAVGAG